MVWTDIFIKRPVLAVVVSLLILLIGFRAATTLPIRQYPKLSNTVVNITTVYPGASPDLIQGFITTPIEQAVASAEGVDYMTSSSVLGTSTIQVYIKLNFDPNQALTEVLAKVNSVKYLIPKESNDPIVTKTTGQTTAVMYLGFSSDVLTGSAISDYLTRVVQPVLSTVDGVACTPMKIACSPLKATLASELCAASSTVAMSSMRTKPPSFDLTIMRLNCWTFCRSVLVETLETMK